MTKNKMNKIKKMWMLTYLGAMVMLPKISLAQGWSIGGGVDSEGGWSIGGGIGSGTGSGGLSSNSYGLPGGSIFGIVEGILMWMLGILSVISLIGFIISGIMYLTAAGDETQAEKAKKAMLYSIIGVIVGLSGYVIFQAAQLMLGGQSF
jgi:hypothetical protein